MDLKFDSDEMATIASAAIFDAMSADTRESVIKEAVKFLLTPEKDRGRIGFGKTPLQQSFEMALNGAARDAIAEKVKNDPEVKAQIDNLLGPLINTTLESAAQNADDRLASHLGDALGSYLADAARDRWNSR